MKPSRSLHRFFLLLCLALLCAAPAVQAQGVCDEPGDRPGKVTGVTLTPGNQSITVGWTPPADPGNHPPLTHYLVHCTYPGLTYWQTEYTEQTSYTVTSCRHSGPLQNGTRYTFRVQAGNSLCRSSEAEADQVSMTAGVPTAPTLTATAASSPGQVNLSWPAPTNNGSAITKYQYQTDTGSWTDTTSRMASVTGLTNGQEYTFRVRAVNGHGTGPAGEATAMPLGPPVKPRNLSATDNNQDSKAVRLTWDALSSSTDTGGSAITGWKYQQDTGDWTAIANSGASTTSHTVTGLTNGTEYIFKVRAVNAKGDGTESDAVKATPSTTPAKPTLSATDNDQASGAVRLTWDELSSPTDTGGSAITGWKYRQDNGIWKDVPSSGASTTSHTVTGLDNGRAYTFKVRAVNKKGDGAESDAATATPATTPSAPRSLTAAPTSGQAKQVTLTWTVPADTGGANISGYEYQQNGGAWAGAGPASPYTVTGLENGTTYIFKVRAVNKKGNSAASNVATATTHDVPAAPTNLTATDGDREVALSWTAPTDNGGLAITGWKYSQDNGNSWTGTGGISTSHTVTVLDNGTEYTFKVRAVNAAGGGTASAAVTATPATTPAKPTLTVVPGNKQMRLEGRLVANETGGANITGWEYRQKAGAGNYGNWTPIQNSQTNTLSARVTGLENGTAYTFKVRAVNRKGEGTESDEETATPRNFTATAGNQSVTLNWSALQTTATIAKWQYQQHGGTWADIPNSTASTTSHTVTGLDNFKAYTFQVRALDSSNTPVEHVEFPAATPQPPTAPVQIGGGSGSGTGGDTSAALRSFFESPVNGAVVSGIDVIRGWSFAEEAGVGIAQVALYLDGQRTAVIPCCSSRADVSEHHPGFPVANTGQSGWGITWNWGNLAAGRHSLRVVVTGTDGGRWASDTRTVTVVKPGGLAWADTFSLAEAEAWLDAGQVVLSGVVLGDATTEQEIEARYVWQTGAQGLRLVASRSRETARLRPFGLERLLAGLRRWGRQVLRPGSVSANDGITRFYEAPADRARVTGVDIIRGWAFPDDATDTIATVTVEMNGTLRESAPCCSTRADVADQYPGQANAELSGWGIVQNYGNLPEGEHTVSVRIATEAGLETPLETRTVTVARLGGYAYVDRFDLDEATVLIEGEEIILSGVEVRDQASQAWETIEVRLQWSKAVQGLVLVDTEPLP